MAGVETVLEDDVGNYCYLHKSNNLPVIGNSYAAAAEPSSRTWRHKAVMDDDRYVVSPTQHVGSMGVPT